MAMLNYQRVNLSKVYSRMNKQKYDVPFSWENMLQVSVHDCPLATTNMGQDSTHTLLLWFEDVPPVSWLLDQ